MNVQHTPTAGTQGYERHSYVRLLERWIVPARGVWLALVVLTLAIFVVFISSVQGFAPLYVTRDDASLEAPLDVYAPFYDNKVDCCIL